MIKVTLIKLYTLLTVSGNQMSSWNAGKKHMHPVPFLFRALMVQKNQMFKDADEMC